MSHNSKEKIASNLATTRANKTINKIHFDNPGVNSVFPERIKANLAPLEASQPKTHNYHKASDPITPVAPCEGLRRRPTCST